MCERKSGVIELAVGQCYDENHIMNERGPTVTVWYCKKCQMLDIETNTPIATLFQGIL